MQVKSQNFFKQVYLMVRQIPRGKVATYGQIAKILGTRSALRVGQALYANRDPAVPCHRVVNHEGRIAINFGMGGWQEHQRRLEAEGVEVVDKIVNLKKYLYNF